MRKIILLLAVSTMIACSKGAVDCSYISENYKPYNGEDLDCQFYYTRAEFNNQEYLELNSRCADLVRPYVIGEDCVDICENDPYNPDSECGIYLRGRNVLEIVLIQK